MSGFIGGLSQIADQVEREKFKASVVNRLKSFLSLSFCCSLKRDKVHYDNESLVLLSLLNCVIQCCFTLIIRFNLPFTFQLEQTFMGRARNKQEKKESHVDN